jgi:hypothetical protein
MLLFGVAFPSPWPVSSRLTHFHFLTPIASPDVGDGKIGKGEIACYICLQTMVYKEAKN